mmetsp:Transcript_7266/g.13564  ORF Transcript_7266/g.13564 Transcript_7266/m.13564 type:complete len:330 (+) Transcript_7266:89-1078(+)
MAKLLRLTCTLSRIIICKIWQCCCQRGMLLPSPQEFERFWRVGLVFGHTRYTYFRRFSDDEVFFLLGFTIEEHYDPSQILFGRLVSLARNDLNKILLGPRDPRGVAKDLEVGFGFGFFLLFFFLLLLHFHSAVSSSLILIFAVLGSRCFSCSSFYLHLFLSRFFLGFFLLGDRKRRGFEYFLLLLLLLPWLGVGEQRRLGVGLDSPVLRHFQVLVKPDHRRRRERQADEVDERVPVPELREESHADDGRHPFVAVVGQQRYRDVAASGVEDAGGHDGAELGHHVSLGPQRFVDLLAERLHSGLLRLVVLDEHHRRRDERGLAHEVLRVV